MFLRQLTSFRKTGKKFPVLIYMLFPDPEREKRFPKEQKLLQITCNNFCNGSRNRLRKWGKGTIPCLTTLYKGRSGGIDGVSQAAGRGFEFQLRFPIFAPLICAVRYSIFPELECFGKPFKCRC